MKKLANWLLFGLSGQDVIANNPKSVYQDSFFVISKNTLQVFTTTDGYERLHSHITLVSNCNVFVATQAQEDDTETFEILKVSKFYEMIQDKHGVAIPVHALDKDDFGAKNDAQIVE